MQKHCFLYVFKQTSDMQAGVKGNFQNTFSANLKIKLINLFCVYGIINI